MLSLAERFEWRGSSSGVCEALLGNQQRSIGQAPASIASRHQHGGLSRESGESRSATVHQPPDLLK